MKRLFAEDPDASASSPCASTTSSWITPRTASTAETLSLLLELAEACGLKDAIAGCFAGDRINETENRAVLHTPLRNRANPRVRDGKDVMPGSCRPRQMQDFSKRVRSGD